MKINRLLTSAILATGMALACSTSRIQAQTIITNTYTFTFADGGASSPFNSTWIYWYNSPGGNSPISVDPTTDASNPIPGHSTSGSGSLMVVSPLAGYTQNVFFGTFASNINNAYDFSVEADTTKFQTVSFDILVASNTPLSANTNYGAIEVGFINSGYGYEEITGGTITIPASASSNWFHVSVPIDQTQGFGDVPGIALDINSYGGYPLFTITNWIDNISINGSNVPPPPPPTLLPPQKSIAGLNCIDTSPSANDDRYQVLNTNDGAGGLSFVGKSSVTYSWNIKSFPTQDPGYSYQAHFFIVSGSDSTNTTTYYPGPYDQAADYNLANCIFVTVQGDGSTGAVLNFRYKTNEISGNSMLFNTVSPTNTTSNPNGWPIMPVCSLHDPTAVLGTWSVTFANTTDVTITSPSGLTTNFVLDLASANLFADPCSLLLGAQPNSVFTSGNQTVVYKSFSLSGTSAAFTDNFDTDSALNTNIWQSYANDPNGLVLVPPTAAYWVTWTLPAAGFGLFDTATLPPKPWKTANVITTIKNGPTDQALIGASGLPSANTGYFALVSNSLSQLVVILPGQTFTPGVAPGYSGTPTPVNTGGNYYPINVTVYAVDQNYNLVNSTDPVNITGTTDGGALTPTSNQNLVNGTTTFEASGSDAFFFSGTPSGSGGYTLTATDESNTAITGTSAAVVVN